MASPERTALDLARHMTRDAAVVRLDALARATGVTGSDVQALAHRYQGGRGLCRAEIALSLMDGRSGSPRETSIRLALIDAGFPSPEYVTTTAMGYEAPMVGIEFGTTSESVVHEGWTMIFAAGTASPKRRLSRS